MFVAALWSLTGIQAAGAAPRNILFIIGDDIGVDSTEFYPLSAGRMMTNPVAPPMPTLNALAQQGVVYKSAWVYMECSPTRSSVFTGRYALRTHVGAWIDSTRPTPPLSFDEFTLADAFRAANAHLAKPYMIALSGKSHMGYENQPDDLRQWGFPLYWTTVSGGALGHYTGFGMMVKSVENVDTVVRTSSGIYATTRQVNDTVNVIRDAKAADRPYFVWLAFNAPHSPYQEPPANLLYRSPTGTSNRAIYERMIEAMDHEIGRLLKEVDLTTTTVVFLGDNGTPKGVMASPYGRNGKSSIYEGGIRAPLLIAGAGVTAPGRVYTPVVSGVDLYKTFLELADINPSSVIPPSIKFDGVSLMPTLTSATAGPVRPFVYSEQFPAGDPTASFQRAIRNNKNYKLVERAGSPLRHEFYKINGSGVEGANLLNAGPLSGADLSNYNSLLAQLNALVASR